ncbi:conjugal transfer protein TraM [Methylomonas sp. AM2-LC]|uniref:conjugal transfer protein TraM n=1 Tax=Methylomonas sp. AM2-LC TaxID=3153301 RepID=UPI003265E39D
MSTDLDELIKEVAAKHGVAVGRDDPIMILHTINQRLMQDSQKAQEEMLESFKSELEAISQRWGLDANDKAEKVLTASLNASKQSMEQLMQTATNQYLAKLKSEVDISINRLNYSLRDAYRISVLNILAASITIVGASVVIWLSIHH